MEGAGKTYHSSTLQRAQQHFTVQRADVRVRDDNILRRFHELHCIRRNRTKQAGSDHNAVLPWQASTTHHGLRVAGGRVGGHAE